jgi:hypothetical protein
MQPAPLPGEAEMTLLAEATSVDPLDIPINRADLSCFLPDPEEGHRLIQIFFSIKQPALRQAIIKFAMDLSKVGYENQ